MTDLSSRPIADLTVEFGTRPSAPRFPDLAPEKKREGQRLKAIHYMHRRDLERIGAFLDQIEAGQAQPLVLANAVSNLEMSENVRTFGALCGRECRVLNGHHDIEQHHLFPALEATPDPAVQAVVQRLRDEHEVVHELLLRLERAAMTLLYSETPETFAECRNVFRQLQGVINSHFSYEETELADAIGFYNVMV